MKDIPELAFFCPFCGNTQLVRIGTFTLGNGTKEREVEGAVHEMPVCEKFIELEMPDYLAACRREMNKFTN